jgi:hypothetical protein
MLDTTCVAGTLFELRCWSTVNFFIHDPAVRSHAFAGKSVVANLLIGGLTNNASAMVSCFVFSCPDFPLNHCFYPLSVSDQRTTQTYLQPRLPTLPLD